MTLRKISKIGAGIVMTCSLVFAAPVKATSEYPGRDYPTQRGGNPYVFILSIDQTNNQLQFNVDTWRTAANPITKIKASWIKDEHVEEVEKMHLLTYDIIDQSWLEKIVDVPAPYLDFLSAEAGVFHVYTFDSEVSLKDNHSGKMFYIVEFADGTKWINRVSYEKCQNKWVMGKYCTVNYYQQNKEYDSVVYDITDAPEKFIRKHSEPEEKPAEEPKNPVNPDPIVNQEDPKKQAEETKESTKDDKVSNEEMKNPDGKSKKVIESSGDSGVLNNKDKPKNSDTQNESKKLEEVEATKKLAEAPIVSKNNVSSQTKESDSKKNEVKVSKISLAETVKRSIVKLDDPNSDETDDHDDEDESETKNENNENGNKKDENLEKPEELLNEDDNSKLEVPKLGGEQNDAHENMTATFIVSIIGGAAIGAIITLFLISMIKKRKENKENL